MIELPRRKFLAGLAGIISAPAIVRASSIMPVRGFDNQLDNIVEAGNWIGYGGSFNMPVIITREGQGYSTPPLVEYIGYGGGFLSTEKIIRYRCP